MSDRANNRRLQAQQRKAIAKAHKRLNDAIAPLVDTKGLLIQAGDAFPLTLSKARENVEDSYNSLLDALWHLENLLATTQTLTPPQSEEKK